MTLKLVAKGVIHTENNDKYRSVILTLITPHRKQVSLFFYQNTSVSSGTDLFLQGPVTYQPILANSVNVQRVQESKPSHLYSNLDESKSITDKNIICMSLCLPL